MIDIDFKQIDHFYGCVFALACCERAFPVYEIFCARNNFGDSDRVRKYLDDLWKDTEMQKFLQERSNGILQDLDSIIPDTDDFDDVYVGSASYFGSILFSLIAYISKSNSDELETISDVMIDSINDYIEAASCDGIKIDGQKILTREENKQHDDFYVLSSKGDMLYLITSIKKSSSYDFLTI